MNDGDTAILKLQWKVEECAKHMLVPPDMLAAEERPLLSQGPMHAADRVPETFLIARTTLLKCLLIVKRNVIS